jgi:hypothetical protein
MDHATDEAATRSPVLRRHIQRQASKDLPLDSQKYQPLRDTLPGTNDCFHFDFCYLEM